MKKTYEKQNMLRQKRETTGGKLLEAADNISTHSVYGQCFFWDTSGRLIAACTKKRNVAQDEDWEEPGQHSDLCSC